MKRALAFVFAIMIAAALSACGSPSPSPTENATAAPPPTAAPETTAPEEPTATPEPTDTLAPTDTPEPSPTGDTADSAGSGSILFDIYQSSAQRDINFDGTAEDITFTSGASKSTLEINGTSYDVAQGGLAQEFAITDFDTKDKYLEFVFTDAYNASLADSEKAYSWMYFWNGSKLILMGGLMDVKFAGAWRSSFKAEDVIDGKGEITHLTRSQELTDVWYYSHFRTSGSNRKLYEYRYPFAPVNEVGVLTCKTVCILFADHKEVKRDSPTYMGSGYADYWNTSLPPTTLGRVLNPAEGIKVIAQPGDKLTVVGMYGPTWFKVKTQDGIIGWIYCKGKHVGGYYKSMGWTAEDMFDGLTTAG